MSRGEVIEAKRTPWVLSFIMAPSYWGISYLTMPYHFFVQVCYARMDNLNLNSNGGNEYSFVGKQGLRIILL